MFSPRPNVTSTQVRRCFPSSVSCRASEHAVSWSYIVSRTVTRSCRSTSVMTRKKTGMRSRLTPAPVTGQCGIRFLFTYLLRAQLWHVKSLLVAVRYVSPAVFSSSSMVHLRVIFGLLLLFPSRIQIKTIFTYRSLVMSEPFPLSILFGMIQAFLCFVVWWSLGLDVVSAQYTSSSLIRCCRNSQSLSASWCVICQHSQSLYAIFCLHQGFVL